MSHLCGTTAIVTGSSRGIGRAIALELARCGSNVVVNYIRNHEQAHIVSNKIRELGRASEVIQADVSIRDQVRILVGRTLERFGSIEILVNNAGIIRDKTIRRMTIDMWRDVMAVDLNGVFNCMHEVVPHMIEKKYGRIVNIASIVGQTGAVGQTNYAAAKAGIIGLTKSAALELAHHGITVNAVCPGYCETDMLKSIPDDIREMIRRRIPMGRFAMPEEVARCVRFLVSEGDYMTGQSMNVNGGLYM